MDILTARTDIRIDGTALDAVNMSVSDRDSEIVVECVALPLGCRRASKRQRQVAVDFPDGLGVRFSAYLIKRQRNHLTFAVSSEVEHVTRN